MKCQICLSNKLIMLKDTIYCENCNIYYSIHENNQLIKSLPIKIVSQVSLELCNKCKNIERKGFIRCKTFQQYLNKLSLCRKCKNNNRDFLGNIFYKNFLLHKKNIRIFGWKFLLFFIIYYYFSSNYFSSFFYQIFLSFVIDYFAYKFTFSRFLFFSLLFYTTKDLEFVRIIFFFYFLYHILFTKTIVFDVPLDSSSEDGLNSFINRLSISDDVEVSSLCRKPRC